MRSTPNTVGRTVGLILAVFLLTPGLALAARGGTLVIKTVDDETGEPVAVRMHLKDARGKPVRAPRLPFWKDHFVFDGQVGLELPRGLYRFEIERGPEYKDYRGHFEIIEDANDVKTIRMHRFVDMSAHGWWSGELHIHRPLDDVELLMKAEDLHVAPVITWWQTKDRTHSPKQPLDGVKRFDEDRFYTDRAGEDERAGGALLYFGLDKPLDTTGAKEEFPSSAKFLLAAKRNQGVHVDVEKPFWEDVPMWLASRRVDSIGLANNHLWRSGVLDNEAWGRKRDLLLYPPPHGNGRWSEKIYYEILNTGMRIPPSAGSASGVLPNPVGYNRVYVYCGENFSYERWWQGLRAGRVVVTNGPLLRLHVDNHLPGHVFQGKEGDSFELEIGLDLATREKVEYLEIVKNGRPLHQVRLDEFVNAKGKLPKVAFDASGWFLVKAVTNNDQTYRFASSGPYYVEFDGNPRVSRSACQFFLDWAEERADQITLSDPGEYDAVMRYHRAAVKFWSEMVGRSNAE